MISFSLVESDDLTEEVEAILGELEQEQPVQPLDENDGLAGSGLHRINPVTLPPEIVDVTIPVQCLVEDPSRLILYEGSKSSLAGFFDPCFADAKEGGSETNHLLVRYSYKGHLHQVVISDQEQLRLPKNTHRL